MEQNTNEYRREEVTFKELILGLIKEWKLIVAVSSIIFLLSLIYAIAFTKHVYEANLDFIIKVPEVVETRYGEYTFASKNLNDYTSTIKSNQVIDDIYLLYGGDKTQYKLTKAQISDMITVVSEKDSNRFEVSIQHTNAELAKLMLEDVYKSFETNLRINTKNSAISEFKNAYAIELDIQKVELDKQKNIIAADEKLLEDIERIYILEKALLSDTETAALYANENGRGLESMSGDKVAEEFATDSYLKLQANIVEEKSTMNELDQELNKTQLLYNEIITEEKLAMDVGNTQNKSQILNGKLDVFNGLLTLSSSATVPEKPVSGGKAIPLAIGIVLGAMIGIFVGLFKNYWKDNR